MPAVDAVLCIMVELVTCSTVDNNLVVTSVVGDCVVVDSVLVALTVEVASDTPVVVSLVPAVDAVLCVAVEFVNCSAADSEPVVSSVA